VAAGSVLVATEQDSVYSFDAANGRLRWHNKLATPVRGGALPCGNIDPSGITSTPVVDVAKGVVYAVAFESGIRHLLYALSLRSGRVLWSRDVDPPGVDPKVEQQRGALTLAGGKVYVPYGGLYGDCGDFHGVLTAVPTGNPAAAIASYEVPTGEAGIWAPSGAAVDRGGDIYIATGNGSSSSFDYGNAVIRLTPGLAQVGFFAPADAGALNQSDLDLGSTGPILLSHSRAFIIGKTGIGYLLSTDQLGGLGHPLASSQVCDRAFGGSAAAGSTVYVPCTDGLAAATVSGDTLSMDWRQAAATQSPIAAGPGVWALGGDQLFQLDRASGRIAFSATVGAPAPFASPAAAGGRVFVAAADRIQAFS